MIGRVILAIAAAAGLLGAVGWAVRVLSSAGAGGGPAPWSTVVLGLLGAVLVIGGLLALMVYSNRRGYDERAQGGGGPPRDRD